MTLADYSIKMIHENFPTLELKDIEKVYYKYEELYTTGEKKDQYKEEMKNQKYEPIGYYTIEELMEGIGKDKYIKRKGASLHHPFE